MEFLIDILEEDRFEKRIRTNNKIIFRIESMLYTWNVSHSLKKNYKYLNLLVVMHGIVIVCLNYFKFMDVKKNFTTIFFMNRWNLLYDEI